VRWLSQGDHAGEPVLAMDVEKIYAAMCEALGWQRYPWQPVAIELRELTGGGKHYRWHEGHRRRVYCIQD
jgi:hypothetical protein